MYKCIMFYLTIKLIEINFLFKNIFISQRVTLLQATQNLSNLKVTLNLDNTTKLSELEDK